MGNLKSESIIYASSSNKLELLANKLYMAAVKSLNIFALSAIACVTYNTKPDLRFYYYSNGN